MDSTNYQLQFIKMAIDKVKQYARDNNCSIDEACGPITGVSKETYEEAIQLMIRTGNRSCIYNKVQLPWDNLDVVHNYGVRARYPHLYREVNYPEITVREKSENGYFYCLSDEAYNEWVAYRKEQTRIEEY